MMTELKAIGLESNTLFQERIDQMRELFPEVFSESGIDFEKLRLELRDEVDDADERYAFTWPGKRNAIRQSQTASTATLRPCPEKSRGKDGRDGVFDSDNIYIEGDNLEVLKLLQRAYHGKVKLIYIDPPYNTGHDFVYHDSFENSIENYKEQAGLVGQSNADTSGRYHADWCSMMYPRLRLARELLADDGAIFISIDDNESANLRKICDEVFGECFVGDIAWQRTYSPRNDSKGIPVEIEHILVYSRQPGWNPGRLPRTGEMDNRYASPDNDPVPWSSGDAAAPGAATHHGMVYAIQHPITGQLLYPSNGRCWTFGQQQMLDIMNGWAEYELRLIDDASRRSQICGCSVAEMEQVPAIMLKDDTEETYQHSRERYSQGNWPRLYFTSNGIGGIRCKRYLNDVDGKLPTNYWSYAEVGHSDEATKELKKLFGGSAPFDTPKPVRLMDRILTIASTSDSIVLDFFSGSASMAHAVIQKNAEDGGTRHFILVQIPEAASAGFDTLCDVGEERISRAGDRIMAELEESNRQLELGGESKQLPDIGFRVFKLDKSGIRKPKEGQLLIDRVKPDRTELDIIFEVMIKWGLELTYPVEQEEICGYPVYSVAFDELICCMRPGLTVEALEAIVEREPRRVFLLDSAIDDTIKLNALQIIKRVEERTQQKIDLRTV